MNRELQSLHNVYLKLRLQYIPQVLKNIDHLHFDVVKYEMGGETAFLGFKVPL